MLICGIKDGKEISPFAMKEKQNLKNFRLIRFDKNLIRAARGLIYDLPSPVNISYF